MYELNTVYPMQPGGRHGLGAQLKAPLSEEGTKQILESVRTELRRWLDSEEFGPEQLAAIAALADRTRDMTADFGAELKKAAGQLAPGSGAEVGPSGELLGALSGSPVGENFGGNVIRQLVPALTQLAQLKSQPTLAEMVQAAASAKQAGLDDLAEELADRVRARVGRKSPEQPAPTPGGNGKGDANALVST